jgi:hypothetical protein
MIDPVSELIAQHTETIEKLYRCRVESKAKDAEINRLSGILATSIILPDDHIPQVGEALEEYDRMTAILELLESWRPEVSKSLVDGE